jgi:tetratricopeptide (TPR) repeat protein
LRPVPLGEKGVVPFYRSIDVALGIDACATPIYLNNREVTFDEYFARYCEEYDDIGTRELFGYIAGNVTKVVVTNHKTGTLLMQGILREYCTKYGLRLLELSEHLAANNERLGVNLDEVDPDLDFQGYDFIFITHAQHFEILVDAVPNLRYRAVHLIRNPYEIIMSGVRYHQITDEGWCNKKLFVADKRGPCGFRRIAGYDVDENAEVGDHTYREIMNLLPDDEKIEFEIRNHDSTFSTILYIESFLKRFQADGNVSTVRLEDIGTEECIKYVFAFLCLNEDFLDSYRSKVASRAWLGGHVTNARGTDTHQKAFNDRLYDLFAAQFGAALLHDFGYASSSPLPEYFAAAGGTVDDKRRTTVGTGGLSIVAARRKADELYELGDKLLAQDDLSAAKEAFEGSLKFDGKRMSTLGRLGDVCSRLKRYEEALTYYERIGSLTDELPAWAYIGLANSYDSLGQTQAAIKNIRLALNLMPDLKRLRARLEKLEASVS